MIIPLITTLHPTHARAHTNPLFLSFLYKNFIYQHDKNILFVRTCVIPRILFYQFIIVKL